MTNENEEWVYIIDRQRFAGRKFLRHVPPSNSNEVRTERSHKITRHKFESESECRKAYCEELRDEILKIEEFAEKRINEIKKLIKEHGGE